MITIDDYNLFFKTKKVIELLARKYVNQYFTTSKQNANVSEITFYDDTVSVQWFYIGGYSAEWTGYIEIPVFILIDESSWTDFIPIQVAIELQRQKEVEEEHQKMEKEAEIRHAKETLKRHGVDYGVA